MVGQHVHGSVWAHVDEDRADLPAAPEGELVDPQGLDRWDGRQLQAPELP
ncbi:hypothetical protein [Streptomyces sp. NPDC059003]